MPNKKKVCPMKEMLHKILLHFEEIRTVSFQHGYFTGVAVSVLILLLFILLYLLLRAPVKSKGILLSTPNGTLFITSSAISDLIREVEKNFPSLKILKSVLLEKKGGPVLDLKVNFQKMEGNLPLPVIAESLQTQISDAMKNTFGIENVKEINIEVIRGKNFSRQSE